jgi:hypothetical protein
VPSSDDDFSAVAQRRTSRLEPKMNIDPPLLSAVSALIGALMGGGASLTAAVYTQRRQDRLQRVAREITKRETVYADFIMTASKLLLRAYVNEGVRLDADEQHLIGLANRMRLFAPPSVIEQAEAVIREIVDLSRKPGMDVRKLTVEEVAERRHSDPLLPFSVASRSDLDHVYQTLL